MLRIILTAAALTFAGPAFAAGQSGTGPKAISDGHNSAHFAQVKVDRRNSAARPALLKTTGALIISIDGASKKPDRLRLPRWKTSGERNN